MGQRLRRPGRAPPLLAGRIGGGGGVLGAGRHRPRPLHAGRQQDGRLPGRLDGARGTTTTTTTTTTLLKEFGRPDGLSLLLRLLLLQLLILLLPL